MGCAWLGRSGHWLLCSPPPHYPSHRTRVGVPSHRNPRLRHTQSQVGSIWGISGLPSPRCLTLSITENGDGWRELLFHSKNNKVKATIYGMASNCLHQTPRVDSYHWSPKQSGYLFKQAWVISSALLKIFHNAGSCSYSWFCRTWG